MFLFIFMLSFTSNAYASSTIRLSGESKYETSVSIARYGWKQSDYAILAYGENYPDALSAAPLAKKYNAPILLTSGNNLPSVTKQILKDLQVKKVFIIGGTGVIPASIDAELLSMGMDTPTRIAGLDRYETSIRIAQQLSSPTELIVTTGEDYSDALSIAPIASAKQIPIILVAKNSTSDTVKNYIASLNVNKTYVIGDSSIIGDSVSNQFPNPERIIGANKYERNIAISRKFESILDLSNISITTGEGFADALTGVAYAAKINAPIIFANSSSASNNNDYYQKILTNAKNIYVFGGTGVVSENIIQGENGSTVSFQSIPVPVEKPVQSAKQVSRSYSSELVDHALSLLGVRYVYGGTSRSGFDCSGFTQYVFKGSGISLPRTAAEQYRVGSSVAKAQLQPGDLVFFSTYTRGASHVGIYIGGGSFVDASNIGVGISSLGSDYYASRYIGARRVG